MHWVCGGPKASVGQGRKSCALLIVTVLIESHNEMSKVHMASCHHTGPLGIKLVLDYIVLLELQCASALLDFFLYVLYFLSLFLFNTIVQMEKIIQNKHPNTALILTLCSNFPYLIEM